MANWALVFGANPEGKVWAVSFLNFLLSFLFLCYQDPRPKEMFGERVLGLTDMAGIFSNVNIFFRLRLCHVRAALAFVTNTSTREAQRINPFILHRLLDTSNLHKFDEGFIKVNLNADMRPLRNIIHGALNRGEYCLLLKDVCSLQNWHREVISFQLPPNLLSRIKATPFSIHASGTNRISWATSPSGEFELKDAYRLASLNTNDLIVNPFVGNWVWKTNTMLKIKCFLW